LREYYLQIGNLPINKSKYIYDPLLELNELYIEKNKYLVFCLCKHRKGAEYFYILLKDLEKDNPIVYLRENNKSYTYEDSLDSFLFNIALSHAFDSLKYIAAWNISTDEIRDSQNETLEDAYYNMFDDWTNVEINGMNGIYKYNYYTLDYSEIVFKYETFGDRSVIINYASNYKDKYLVFKEKIEKEMEGYITEYNE
jgi:hypothetical protein